MALLLVVVVLLFDGAFCYPKFQREIPNGDRIPSPCNRNQNWPGVGHELLTGPGPLNRFGMDFIANGKKWSPTLCRLDSDGDGKTNGEELGDPTCVWTSGSTHIATNSTQLSHPGVCDPIDSDICVGKVNFLKHVNACSDALNVTSYDWCTAIRTPDVKSLELRFDKAELPALETNYFCQTFQVPADQDYHIIAWEPLIDNPEVMHHMIMFICDSPVAEANINTSGNYKMPIECGLTPKECQNQNIAWMYGMDPPCFNNDTGYLMGKNYYRTVILQIHYNNPALKSGIVDSSGVQIYYTANRRPNDMGVIRVGQDDISIAPHSSSTTLIGRAFRTRECAVNSWKPSQSYKITSMGFHMHKMATHAKLTLEKQNGSKIVIVDGPFSYDRPSCLAWESSKAIIFEPGDNFVIECTFQTAKKDNWTFFGKSTQDEMCLALMDVHPRPQDHNFIAFANYGLLETCDFSRRGICLPETLENISLSMTNDKTNLSQSCYNEPLSESDTCCSFLNKHNFFQFDCVFDSAYELVQSLVPNLNEFARIHNNIVKCITLTQMKQLQDVKPIKETATNHASSNFVLNIIAASILSLLGFLNCNFL